VNAFLNTLNSDSAEALDDIVSVLERSIPLEAIYADYSSTPQSFEETEEATHEDLRDKLAHFYMLLTSSGSVDKDSFTRMILGLKPFSENRELTQRIIEELV
jgi:hypothetical protein